MEITDPREIALVQFHRMTPAQQAAERTRLHNAAYEAALARLTPERRAIAEQRKADSLAAIEAEKVRVAALTPDERQAEMALRQKLSAEAALARISPAVVAKVEASPVIVDLTAKLAPDKLGG